MEMITETLVESVFTVVGMLIAVGVSYFAPKLKRKLDKIADKDNLGIMSEVIDMAVEYAEKEFSGELGEAKFNQATAYVAMMAERYGIDVSKEFIKGGVQKGWRKMNEKQKEGE